MNQVVAIVYHDQDAQAIASVRPKWKIVEVARKEDVPEILSYV